MMRQSKKTHVIRICVVESETKMSKCKEKDTEKSKKSWKKARQQYKNKVVKKNKYNCIVVAIVSMIVFTFRSSLKVINYLKTIGRLAKQKDCIAHHVVQLQNQL